MAFYIKNQNDYFYGAVKALRPNMDNYWACEQTEEEVAAGKRPRIGVWGSEIGCSLDGTPEYEYKNPDSQPTEAAIDAKIAEMEAAESMYVLRAVRDEKLKETDWMANPDAPTMSQAWKDYRQALRDITDIDLSGLVIGEEGDPEGFDWPVKPS